MRILALETSTADGSLALLDDARLVWEASLPGAQRTAQTFASTMERALADLAWEPASIGLFAVTNGPGSFTGLRISVTAAKLFAYATGAELVAVNTLDVLAEQLPSHASSACALMDAQRQQFFTATYRRATNGLWQIDSSCRVRPLAEIPPLIGPSTVLTGPGLSKLPTDFLPHQPRAESACWTPRASTVGLRAWHDYCAEVRTDPWLLRPEYYRPSYAEEPRPTAGTE